ncbi:SPOR domain-containing protein [Cohnella sp. GbtcB17]|uniref:SPOR domain-containing protein n=1 Tax=Cohnella sp. GbtcB17 TaxID=2824762 RepID=UPI001C303991|nr:SPOR domain-containing protein [Cohnella sp. GbtcB17]
MQPPSRMTFKFEGNLPREVRNDSADQQKAEQQASGQGSENAAHADPAVRGFKPRGFSAQAGRQAPTAGSGYRLPGKGAHIGQGRQSPPPKSDAPARVVLAEAGAQTAERMPSYPAQDSKPPHASPSRALPSNTHNSDTIPSGKRQVRSQAQGRPTARDARSGPYEDDVEALEQLIRGADRERGRHASEDRTRNSGSANGAVGRVAGFRKPASAPSTSTRDFPYADLRGTPADRHTQAFDPPYEDQQVYEPPYPSAASGDGIRSANEDPYVRADEHWIDDGEIRRYRSGPSWMRIFVSVAAAIVTGAIFGYIVLALFTGEPILPSGSAADPASAGVKPAATHAAASDGPKTDPAASGQAAAGKANGATTTNAAQPDQAASASGDARVPASVSYLLQYGVFQSEASMNEAVQALTSQGIAAATDTRDGYRVYAGIAAGKAEAEKLAAALTDEELYAKALDNPALSLPQTPAAVSWAAFLEESDALGRLLAATSAGLLTEGGSAQPSAQSDAGVQAATKRWKATTADMAKWSGSRGEPAQALATQLQGATEQWAAYGKEPSAARLRAVQTSTMKAALIARQLREELGEDGD